jgi:hypothetical protein
MNSATDFEIYGSAPLKLVDFYHTLFGWQSEKRRVSITGGFRPHRATQMFLMLTEPKKAKDLSRGVGIEICAEKESENVCVSH